MKHSARSGSQLGFAVRRAIALYAALAVLVDLSVALPGNPDFASTWGVVGCLTVQGLIVWRLSRRSQAAWVLGLGSGALAVFAIYLAAVPLNVSTVLFIAFCLAQVASLSLPPIVRFVWLRRAPLASRMT